MEGYWESECVVQAPSTCTKRACLVWGEGVVTTGPLEGTPCWVCEGYQGCGEDRQETHLLEKFSDLC